MIEQASRDDQPTTGWRLKTGIALFVISIILPIAGIPFVAGLGLSETMVTSVSGVMLIGAELLGMVTVAVMGKPGYLYIKNKVFGFLKQYGPPKEVSCTRYNIGLVMFCVPIVFGWLSPYVADLIPGFIENPTPYAVRSDLLNPDFWALLTNVYLQPFSSRHYVVRCSRDNVGEPRSPQHCGVRASNVDSYLYRGRSSLRSQIIKFKLFLPNS